jgi:CubicO group peptidase (beta-lactamase class C family)
MGVLRLADQRKVDLYQDINNYLRSWKLPSDSFTNIRKVTLAHLLSHTAGLSVHGFAGYKQKDSLPTDNEILDGKRPSNSPAVRNVFAPGTRYQYSGGGTVITKKLITDLTGMAYDQYMYTSVLKPLGMTNSSFSQPPPASSLPHLATGYNSTGAVPGKFHIYPEQAPDGLWTTPQDLALFIIEVQKSLAGRSNKVLSRAMTDTMLTPFVDKSSALGLFIQTRGEDKYFRHGGSNNGFKCEYIASLTNGNGVIVMTNSDEFAIVSEIINSVATVYQWKDFYKPVVKKVIHPDANKLKDYVGEYTLNNALTLRFKLEGGHLYINQDDSPYSRVYFESDDTFFIYQAPGSTVSFVRNAQGNVSHLLIRTGGNEIKADKK